LLQEEKQPKNYKLPKKHLNDRVDWSQVWQKSELDYSFQNVGAVNNEQKVLIVYDFGEAVPVEEESFGFRVLVGSADESLPSIHFVDD